MYLQVLMIYRGEHIYLRTININDVDIIYNWENNPENWKVSAIQQPFSKAQITEFVLSEQDIFVHEQQRFIVCTNDNTIIGNVDLFEFEPEHKRLGIGILIDKPYRNKGFAKQAILLMEAYCKEILNIKNIFCNILEDNPTSIKLFEGLHYQKIGIKPKWHHYNGKWYDEGLYLKALQ